MQQQRGNPIAAPPTDPAGAVVLEYCAVVRGILNDGQGGPLQPPGLRMAEGWGKFSESIQRNLAAKRGCMEAQLRPPGRLYRPGLAGWWHGAEGPAGEQVKEVQRICARCHILGPGRGVTPATRRKRFPASGEVSL